jgi:hypothetical protein
MLSLNRIAASIQERESLELAVPFSGSEAKLKGILRVRKLVSFLLVKFLYSTP